MVYDQNNFSKSYSQMYQKEIRILKAKKALAVIKDFASETDELYLLDIGCSTGIMTNQYSKVFKSTLGIDIDKSAIEFAKKNFQDQATEFKQSSHDDTTLGRNKFDVVICTHVYEHVISPEELVKSIYRILKPGGICYFVAGNRHKIIEPHFKIPFLSFFPNRFANYYLKLFKRDGEYYQKHLSFKKLKELVNQFTIHDYTLKTIKNHSKYFSEDLVKNGSFLQKIYLTIGKVFYFLIPTYIWILKKENISKDFE